MAVAPAPDTHWTWTQTRIPCRSLEPGSVAQHCGLAGGPGLLHFKGKEDGGEGDRTERWGAFSIPFWFPLPIFPLLSDHPKGPSVLYRLQSPSFLPMAPALALRCGDERGRAGPFPCPAELALLGVQAPPSRAGSGSLGSCFHRGLCASGPTPSLPAGKHHQKEAWPGDPRMKSNSITPLSCQSLPAPKHPLNFPHRISQLEKVSLPSDCREAAPNGVGCAGTRDKDASLSLAPAVGRL